VRWRPEAGANVTNKTNKEASASGLANKQMRMDVLHYFGRAIDT
jgi:hypothetical protein